MRDKWLNICELHSKNYTCGYCGNSISSNLGYFKSTNYSTPSGSGYIYICHHCGKPTYFDYEGQTPGSTCGKKFKEEIFVDKNTFKLYEEINSCAKAKAYTAVALLSRKLLMHIGVDCGAEENKTFEFYVNYLNDNGYVSTNCKKWVDIIRKKGNEANHEIEIYEEKDAMAIMKFVEIMISVIYEMPYDASRYGGE